MDGYRMPINGHTKHTTGSQGGVRASTGDVLYGWPRTHLLHPGCRCAQQPWLQKCRGNRQQDKHPLVSQKLPMLSAMTEHYPQAKGTNARLVSAPKVLRAYKLRKEVCRRDHVGNKKTLTSRCPG